MNRARPLLPQIDTEGAEALVLGGARELLASGRVRNLVVEITSAHWFRHPIPCSLPHFPSLPFVGHDGIGARFLDGISLWRWLRYIYHKVMLCRCFSADLSLKLDLK